MLREFGMAAKWLELLKEIGPAVRRVAVLRDPGISQDGGQPGAIQAVASLFSPIPGLLCYTIGPYGYRYGLPDHSAFMPANFTTLADFSVSSAMNLPNS